MSGGWWPLTLFSVSSVCTSGNKNGRGFNTNLQWCGNECSEPAFSVVISNVTCPVLYYYEPWGMREDEWQVVWQCDIWWRDTKSKVHKVWYWSSYLIADDHNHRIEEDWHWHTGVNYHGSMLRITEEMMWLLVVVVVVVVVLAVLVW